MCIHNHDNQDKPLYTGFQHCITSSLAVCIVKCASVIRAQSALCPLFLLVVFWIEND